MPARTPFRIRPGTRYRMRHRLPYRLPHRIPVGSTLRPAPRSPLRSAIRPTARLTFLLLLAVGLLSVLLPCADGTDGHHHVAVPVAAAAAQSEPAAAAPAATDDGHSASECGPGAQGHGPQGRTAPEAQGATPADLGAAAGATAVRWPAPRSAGGSRRPVCDGRSTLAALCRCRI
ncbi:hypothetical protein [Streptomyces sp. NPDC059008]|uniref:hypothetical protein n=1 Tax=Streptomyces sp. NPDC059008 TaxID=3346693 RepID=UPI0036805807